MTIGVTFNNPGDLTVSGANSYPYAGQSGVYHSGDLYYAEFPDSQTGTSALLDYISSNIGTNPADSLTTPGEFASYYLNGSYGPLQNTANNPHAASWLQSLLNATGLSANSSWGNTSPQAIAQGIAAGEGTSSVLNFGSGTPGQQAIAGTGNAFSAGLNELLTNPLGFASIWGNTFAAGANAIVSDPGAAAASYGAAVTGGTSAIGTTAAGAAGGLLGPLVTFLQGVDAQFQAWEAKTFPSIVERTAIGIVAVVLIIAGIFFLAGGPKIVVGAAKAGALA